MRRIVRTLTPLALVLVVAAGCGDDGGQSISSTDGLSPKAVLARAADATVAANSARMSFVMEMNGVPGAGDVTIDGEGAMDFDRHLAVMTMDIPDFGTGVSGEAEIRIVGSVMYMRMPLPEEAANELGGKSWFSIDLREAGKAAGIDVSQQMWSDPRQTLAMLEGVSGEITVVGEEEVRGVDTTHYHADVDLRKAIESAGDVIDPEVFSQFTEQLGMTSIPVDVWVDGENQVRRMEMTMTMPNTDTRILARTELHDFGTDVDVSPPPADDVMDMTDLMDQYGSELDS